MPRHDCKARFTVLYRDIFREPVSVTRRIARADDGDCRSQQAGDVAENEQKWWRICDCGEGFRAFGFAQRDRAAAYGLKCRFRAFRLRDSEFSTTAAAPATPVAAAV